MRRMAVIVVVIVTLGACQNQEYNGKQGAELLKDSATFTNIVWMDSLKNIGTVEPGKKAEIIFRFKNLGSTPLFVISAEPGCGCTVAGYPKEAVAPGAEGSISAAFTAVNGSTGAFRKNISVTTNTKGKTRHSLFFYGEIKEAGEKATQIDTAALQAIKARVLKKNLILKPTKN